MADLAPVPTLSALTCPACRRALRSEDWDRYTGIVTCSGCRALVTVTSPKPPAAQVPTGRQRADVPLPPRMSIEQRASGLALTYRWFTPASLGLLFFCIAWDSFLFFWYTMAFAGNAPLIAVVFPIAHVAVGVGLTYFVLASLLNRTTVHVDGRYMTIQHGPIPWFGNANIAPESLDQLYCKAIVSRSNEDTSSSTSYQVWAAFKDGTSKKLLSTALRSEEAIFIEQRIERTLGIPDRPMPEEMTW